MVFKYFTYGRGSSFDSAGVVDVFVFGDFLVPGCRRNMPLDNVCKKFRVERARV